MSTAAREPLLGSLPLAGLLIPPLVGTTLWSSNMHKVPYEDAVPVLLALTAIAVAALVALRLILRDWTRAGLILAIAAAYLLYAGPVASALSPSPWIRLPVLAAAGVAAMLLALRIPRERAARLDISRKLNFIVLSIALVTGGSALAKQASLEPNRPDPASVFPTFAGRADETSPDVWHIILDRYANSETLQRVYGYDNSPFLQALRERGFAVRESAFSNYQRTSHSVASTLNGAYLDPLSEPMANQQTDLVPIYRSMTDNAALRFFNAQGYETVFAGSWWNPTRQSRLAHRNVNFRAIPELGRAALDQSLVGQAMTALHIPYGDGRADQCFRAHAKFAALRELARSNGRKYVFGHFLVPHPPFVLKADGSCRSLAEAERTSRRENYVHQVRYVNLEMLRLIDAIAAGPRPAIIVLHADEGPWPARYAGDERFLGTDTTPVKWHKVHNPELKEKLGILMAVRAPGGSERDLAASPVNIYPTILHNHFHGPAPNLRDRNILFASNQALYRFKDVTDEVAGPATAH
ncbi:MAG: sulfatase-like hydrolase/transferase [Allosphingosinicella sp.]